MKYKIHIQLLIFQLIWVSRKVSWAWAKQFELQHDIFPVDFAEKFAAPGRKYLNWKAILWVKSVEKVSANDNVKSCV